VKYVEMSDRDVYALETLYKCYIRPTSVTKKWVTRMITATKKGRFATDYQIKEIWHLVYGFRGQIKDGDLIKEAKEKL